MIRVRILLMPNANSPLSIWTHLYLRRQILSTDYSPTDSPFSDAFTAFIVWLRFRRQQRQLFLNLVFLHKKFAVLFYKKKHKCKLY